MKSVWLLVSGILLFSFPMNSIAGGPWAKEKGETFIFGFGHHIGAAFYADNNANIFETTQTLSVSGLHLYGEYGLGKQWEIGGHMPLLQFANGIEDNSTLTGFSGNATGNGDLDIYLKKQLNSGSISSSISVLFGIPLGNSNAGSNKDIMLGDGEFNQMLKVDFGGAFNEHVYWIVFAGFNNRNSGFSDELHFGGEIGYNGDKWLAALKCYSLNSMENGTEPAPFYPGIYANNLEYFAIGPTIMRKWNNSGLIIDIGLAPYLRNIIAAPSFSVGYSIQLGKS